MIGLKIGGDLIVVVIKIVGIVLSSSGMISIVINNVFLVSSVVFKLIFWVVIVRKFVKF